MDVKITIEMEGIEPVEINLDVPDKNAASYKRRDVSMYAKFFDETCMGWTKDAEANKFFLLCQQNYANDKLKKYGWLVLNEIYDMLGMPRTKAGQCVGWYYDEDNPVGDNYVDFGIFEDHNISFINGIENKALLDFNVDGDILQYL
jgi:hypothetical protein